MGTGLRSAPPDALCRLGYDAYRLGTYGYWLCPLLSTPSRRRGFGGGLKIVVGGEPGIEAHGSGPDTLVDKGRSDWSEAEPDIG